MDKIRQAAAVTAVCLSIIIGAVLITYKPGLPGFETTAPSLTTPTTTSVGTAAGYKSVAEGSTSPKTLSVSGTGTITAKSNQATIVLGVYTEDKEASDAIDENAVKMSAVIDAIKALGIAEADMETSNYSIQPVYNWEVKQTVGYQVTNTVSVKVKDLTKIGKVIDAAAGVGANKVDSISFGLTEETQKQMRQQAFDAAIADVKTKADTLTKGFGIKIVGVQSVTESSYTPSNVYRESYDMVKAAGAAPTPILGGSSEVTVYVSVVYLIE